MSDEDNCVRSNTNITKGDTITKIKKVPDIF
jgi:hypothetical protein